MNYVIIGNGVAGFEAAQAIRKTDAEGGIKMISSSPYLYYYRPRLIEYLSKETPADKLIIFKQDYYDKNRIECLLNTTVTKILPGESAVIDDRGVRHPYDRLLIATGAYSFVPPISGADTPGIFALRGISDADKILKYVENVNDVVVIGGGLLGLESAHSLVKLGKKVTVVEFCQWLLPRQLDRDGGRILQDMLEEKGIGFRLNDSVSEIQGAGKVERIALKTGSCIDAGMVLVSSGIRGQVQLAKDAGIQVASGIVVDDRLRTSIENIYAAGDPVEHRGRLYGIWPAAKDQGRIAGLNMAGIPTDYSSTIMANSLKITGIDLYSAGNFDTPNCEVFAKEGAGSYKKLLVHEGKPVSAIVIGDKEAVKVAQKVIDGKETAEAFKKLF